MKFSDIKGKGSLDVIADILELVDKLKGNEDVEAFVGALKLGEQPHYAVCKLAPVLRDKATQDAIVSIIVRVKGYDLEEFAESGNVLGELWEFLTDDAEALAFFG